MEEIRVKDGEEVRFKDMDRVSIPISEYRELIEAKCKAEVEADRNLNDWAREKRRADLAGGELKELQAKCEELGAKYEELKAKHEEELKQNGRD